MPLKMTVTTMILGSILLSKAVSGHASIEASLRHVLVQEVKQWKIHDMDRPQPIVVDPGTCGSAPSDAIRLFDGGNLDHWIGRYGNTPDWTIKDGYFQVRPGGGDIRTSSTYGDCQLHMEWMIPEDRGCDGQSGCNSGVFFQDRYEVQILHSNGNRTYPDGMAASLYGQSPPLVNACRPKGQWNTYDIIYRAPRFNQDGTLKSPARMTVIFNGIPVQIDVALVGDTSHMRRVGYTAHPDKGPIRLQDHGDPICFRNIWVRNLPPQQVVE